MPMQAIVPMLIAFYTALIISGCATKSVVVAPTKCIIPYVDEPQLDLVDKNTTLGEAKRCAYNYTQVKEKYEMLKRAVEVCR
jgi:hypothetical protein